MFFLFSTVYKKYLHLHTAINNNGFCRFGFAIQIIYPGIYNPKSSKDTRPNVSSLLFVFFWGRHIGLRPTWNYLTFKHSCKSFNPKNHSSDNFREEIAFPICRDLKLPTSFIIHTSGFFLKLNSIGYF
jgi:hypothetical protein